jgi:hypothetical protein
MLILLLFVLASIDPVWFSPQAPTVVRDIGLIDDSWHLDQVFKLSRGIWIGRDVAFTHGPIYQLLSSLPARFLAMSMGAIYATWVRALAWCAFVCVYLTLRLLLAEQPAWKRALLLFLVLVFWLPFWEWSLQNAFPVLLFAIFLRGWYAATEGRVKSYRLGTVAALLCIVAFLITSDTGVYAVAAWVIATAAISFEKRRNEHVISRCIVAQFAYAASSFVFALAVNAAMGRTFDFRFWKDGAHIVSVYRWATPAAMTDTSTMRLFGMLLVCAAVFLFRAGTRSRRNPATTERTSFLLGSFAFGVFMLQSALVRSDYWHVEVASFALALLTGTILFSFQSVGSSFAAILFAIACSISSPQRAFGPRGVIRLVRQLRHPSSQCPVDLREFDHACFVPQFTALLQSVAGYLEQHSGPQEQIVVFPYQTMFGIASRRTVAGGLMQAYAASGPYLSQLEIAGLERAPAPAGVYLTDLEWGVRNGQAEFSQADLVRRQNLVTSRPMDGTYNFTRTPEIWFWMLRHYRAEGGALSPGVFGLRRDDSRATRISMHSETLGLAVQTFAIHERSSIVDLGTPTWPAGADFLRLRLTVRYGLWWRLRKPENMQLEITHADGNRELRWFIVQPNASSEIWLYPWSPADLANYLDADESHWRTTPRPAITRLRIIATPLDWVSATPDAIVLEAAESERIDMHP